MIWIALGCSVVGFVATQVLWWLRCRSLRRQLESTRVRIFVPPPPPPTHWGEPTLHKELYDEN